MVDDYKSKAGLILQSDLPENWVSDFVTDCELDAADIEIRQIFSGPMAGLYLYLPQAVMVFFATAFFGPILAEAGKDTYRAMKTAAKRLMRRTKDVEVRQFSAGDKKTESSTKYHLAFSINCETSDGSNWKLVLQTECTNKTAEDGIEDFIDFVGRLNNGREDDADLSIIRRCREIGGTRVLTIEPNSGKITPADPLDPK